MKDLPDSVKGYIAGMIDSDGHVCLRYLKDGDYYIPSVRLRITHEPSVKFIQEATKLGRVCSYVPSQKKINGEPKRRVYEWGIFDVKGLTTFFDAIEPHSIIKKRQMELLRMAMRYKEEGIQRGPKMAAIKTEMANLAIK